MSTCALFAVYVLAASAPGPVRVECDGAVEWKSLEDGSSSLAMSGGVRVKRGDTVLRAREAQVVFGAGEDSPKNVVATGDVVLESPRFRALAQKAVMVRIERRKEGGDAEARQYYIIRLERGDRAWVEVSSGDLELVCPGPVAYDDGIRMALLQGGVRGESPTMDMRAETARITFARAGRIEPAAKVGEPGAAKSPTGASAQQPDVERIDLRGAVEVQTRPVGGSSGRLARAQHAVYESKTRTLTLSGEPAPEIESSGVVLTAPEMRLDIEHNRIESSTGKMKGRIVPPGGGE